MPLILGVVCSSNKNGIVGGIVIGVVLLVIIVLSVGWARAVNRASRAEAVLAYMQQQAATVLPATISPTD